MQYLIWSNEHNKWWGVNCRGYVDSVNEAGRFALSFAVKLCNEANFCWNVTKVHPIPNELPISEEAALLLQYRQG